MKKAFELGFYVTFGAGIAFGISSFTILSELFKVASSFWLVVSICLAGFICMLLSSSIAELASMYPSSPGVRTYLKVALPPRTSLFLVYLYLIFMIMVAGIESYLFALVVRQLFPHLPALAVVITLLVCTVVVNLLGLELPRGVQMFTTTALILSVLFLGVAGAAPHLSNLHWGANMFSGHPLSQISDALGSAIYLFIGFEWVTMMGFSAKSYEHKIPISMPLAILTNIVAYCIFAMALAARMSTDAVTASAIPQLPYFVQMFGPRGAYVGLALSILAIVSCFNAGVMGGSRLIYALAREGNFPKSWGTLSITTGAPIGGVLVLGVLATIASVIIVSFELEEVAAVVGSGIVCCVYAAFVWAVLRLRKTQPNARRTFRSPLPIWLHWVLIVALPAAGVGALFGIKGKTVQVLATTAGLVVVSAVTVLWSTKYKSNEAAMRLQANAS
ncbi:MAG TPA: APC family permease [Candidatus Angelobacter sp.]|jgi:ethanolamine permease|nr:APC family permease [Candidatus Angelobacter sp.]